MEFLCIDFNQDITNPNVLMNFRGRFNGEPGAEFRSTFPVRYMILDYGISHHFAPTSDPITHLIKPFKTLHRYQAPESAGPVPHDPFASDVYMTARLLYDWIHVRNILCLHGCASSIFHVDCNSGLSRPPTAFSGYVISLSTKSNFHVDGARSVANVKAAYSDRESDDTPSTDRWAGWISTYSDGYVAISA
jgi:hypothetical protein